MPKRALAKPSKETLESIKLAHERGIAITEEEALRIRSSSYHLPTPEALPFGATISNVKEDKKGNLRFWTPEEPTGPGKLEMPLTRKIQELERDALTEAAKIRRRPPTDAAAKAKIRRSKRTAIEQAWREYGLNTRNVAKRIAHTHNVSEAYVRRIRAEMRQSERV